MQPTCLALLVPFFLFPSLNANAAGSMLRITCDGDNAGAEVQVNGKFKGECPVDISIPEGKYRLRVVKAVDDAHERVYEQEVRVADGTVKKVEAVLTTRLTASGQQLEAQRLAAERAEAGRIRAQIDADIASGAIPARFRDCPDCPEMVLILPGSFEMGSTDGEANEKPVHRVTIAQAFAMGKTEVTQGQWKVVMGDNPSYHSKWQCSDDNCPVEHVSWDDIQEFIRKLNASTGKQYRLPSEAEWEYACRAGGQQQYCGGDNPDAVGWYNGHGGYTTHTVGQKQANAFGLYDMSGNVNEWVADSYHDNYNGAPSDGGVWQGNDRWRMLRGGAYGGSPQNVRAAIRSGVVPTFQGFYDYGFRLARTLP